MVVCSDGLTDMVSSSTIEHLVRLHAGEPQSVVDALVAAANDAGGKDNITVVYAEAPGFSRAVRGHGFGPAPSPAASLPASGSTGPVDPGIGGAANAEPRGAGGPLSGVWWGMVHRRATWFVCGMVIGVVAALALAWRLGDGAPVAPRTLAVGGSGAEAFARIADAMAQARPGDVVQLEPGTYKEQVVVPDGVDLVARLPGKSRLMRGEGTTGEWRAVTAAGATGGRIYGIRIESVGTAPIDVGLGISGAGRHIELVDIGGPMRASIELAGATAVIVRGCLVHTVQGPGLTMDAGSEATIDNNAFVRTGRVVEPALSLNDATRTVVTRNLFAGYGVEIIRGVSADERAQLLSGNFVVAAEPTIAR